MHADQIEDEVRCNLASGVRDSIPRALASKATTVTDNAHIVLSPNEGTGLISVIMM